MKSYRKYKSSKKTKSNTYRKKSKSKSNTKKTQKKIKGGSPFFQPTFANVPLKSMIPFNDNNHHADMIPISARL